MAFKHSEFANCIFDVRIYEWEHSVVIVKEQKANCRTISPNITHTHVTIDSVSRWWYKEGNLELK